MPVKVFITIDTEEDNWGQYKTDCAVDNIAHLPALQQLFNKYGAIPTYLVNYPVATTPSSIEVLASFLNEGVCEIGTHCHPWNTPPYTEELGRQNSMMCNLPYDLLIEKMSNLREATKSSFGVTPVSFRAGRWGFSEDVARCLTELEYKIDTSISPFIDWTRSRGPNFRRASTHPYYFSPDNIFKSVPDGALLEVPPTIGFYQSNFRLCDVLQHSLKGPVVSQLGLLGMLDMLGLLNFHWLSPELSTGTEMVTLAKRFVKSGHKFLNMSFHSTSMLPGKSPFVQNKNDLTKFLNEIEIFLKYATENKFKFLPMAEAVNYTDKI